MDSENTNIAKAIVGFETATFNNEKEGFEFIRTTLSAIHEQLRDISKDQKDILIAIKELQDSVNEIKTSLVPFQQWFIQRLLPIIAPGVEVPFALMTPPPLRREPLRPSTSSSSDVDGDN